ncbi:MAG: glutamate--tRNA ligase [Victivallales bacterium]|nr:glutamate--tRNA ligase [Victivallales bacterium]
MEGSVRVRFAPSPTGQVHIGNIRTAIFNYLFARGGGGEFLLRVEDTDLERSTQEAVDKLLDCMNWLGLDYDGEIYRQSRQAEEHIAAADKLLVDGNAYKFPSKDGELVPTAFRIPWDTDYHPSVRIAGDVKMATHANESLRVSKNGVSFAQISRTGKPMPTAASLAGFHGLKAFDANGVVLFDLNDKLDEILNNEKSFVVENCAKIAFQRREVFYDDVIKGRLSKPLDTMKDLIIVRSDGSPVFHLANVFDDIAQNVTYIVRGDDHVENTYRHILLFRALGSEPPVYGHMPMIVNDQGKPFSKRDGDAFVGDFRAKGYLPEALFNYLAFLGWSPGDERDKMSKEEFVEAFSIDRVVSSPAKFDFAKLANLNGRYIAELSNDEFVPLLTDFARETDRVKVLKWMEEDSERFAAVADLMRSRCKTLADVDSWAFFFGDEIEMDAKLAEKALNPQTLTAIAKFAENLAASAAGMDAALLESAIAEAEKTADLAPGRIMRPLRVAATGLGSGADLVPTLVLIGRERLLVRLKEILSASC